MDLPDIDEAFKRIIAKADKIVTQEIIQKERLVTLTTLREQDGRLKIGILQYREKIRVLKIKINEVIDLLETHADYFRIIITYEGEEQQELLNLEIPGYTWAKYSQIQEYYYLLSQDMTVEEMQQLMGDHEKKLSEYISKRRDLIDNSLTILSEIDSNLKKLEK